jgi:hypothetical protein
VFADERVSLLFKDSHRIKLIRANLIEAGVNPEPQGDLEIGGPSKQSPLFRRVALNGSLSGAFSSGTRVFASSAGVNLFRVRNDRL